MKKFGLPILAMVLALALSACSDSDSPSGGSSGSITANSVSGGEVSLSGTWYLCSLNSGSDDTSETQVFSGTSLTITQSTWTDTGGTCGGTETVDGLFEVTNLANDIDVTMIGWSDRSTETFDTTPTAEDGTTVISATPIYSGLSGTFSGSTTYLAFFVDDTGSSLLLYRAVKEPSSLCGTPIGNYDPCAFTGDILTRQ